MGSRASRSSRYVLPDSETKPHRRHHVARHAKVEELLGQALEVGGLRSEGGRRPLDVENAELTASRVQWVVAAVGNRGERQRRDPGIPESPIDLVNVHLELRDSRPVEAVPEEEILIEAHSLRELETDPDAVVVEAAAILFLGEETHERGQRVAEDVLLAIGGDESRAAKASPGEKAHRAVAPEEVSAGDLDFGAGELLLLVAEAVRERGARALRKRDEHVASKGLRVGREGLDVDAPKETRAHEALPCFRNRRRRQRLAGRDGDEPSHR
jgi:hypothetical protein